MLQLVEFVYMLGIDFLFFTALILVMLPLGIFRPAAYAVMKRNFSGYFSNPTGYVFLCLFVLLTAFAAFWPHEFFTANLANFDQLNKFLPYIMLIFIPAITMSIWAEERRQGTDELLLTFPAYDYDIVIGKYFAAVLIFTVSLLFSQLSNYAVLLAMTGGSLDTGLLFATYLGYWFIGVAMLAIGMVASFLTNNLTIGFIFGAVFNAPLAFFSNADVIVSNRDVISVLYEWSILQRFEPFGRGLISLASVVFFVGLAVLGVYLSLILIGRRHWEGGRSGTSMMLHFVVRVGCMLAILAGCVLVAQHSPLNRLRLDVSEEKVSTLSPSTRDQILELTEGENLLRDPITIDAYIGDTVPTDFIQTKYELVNLLQEFDAIGGNSITVNLHSGVRPFSEEANRAEERFGITPRSVDINAFGTRRTEQVILGAAFTSGLDRLVIPFFETGMGVEYELIRAVKSLRKSDRKTIGLVLSDAYPAGLARRIQNQIFRLPKLRIIGELEKQYDVEIINPNEPISLWLEDDNGEKTERRYAALIAIQPSKMSATSLENLLAAIRSGQPTAIFEDPSPENFRIQPDPNSQPRPYILGTAFARIFGGESCDINKLYSLLGIRTSGSTDDPDNSGRARFSPSLVIQKYAERYKRDPNMRRPEFVLIHQDETTKAQDPRFANDEITIGLTEVCFITPGSIEFTPDQQPEVSPLVFSARNSWLWSSGERRIGRQDYSADKAAPRTLAVRVQGQPRGGGGGNPMDVVYVADMDCISDYFVLRRDQPRDDEIGEEYAFENVSFFMNIVDSLAGVDDFYAVRNRRIRHATLTEVEKLAEEALKNFDEQREELEVQLDQAVNEAQTKIKQDTSDLRRRIEKMVKQRDSGEQVDEAKLEAMASMLQVIEDEKRQQENNKLEQLASQFQQKIRTEFMNTESEIQQKQGQYKLGAVTYPAIPPLLVGLIVFTRRRLLERAGISKARRIK